MNKVKEIRTARYVSGTKIDKEDEIIEGRGIKIFKGDSYLIKPKLKNSKKEFINVSLDDLYEDIKLAVHHFKDDPHSINNSILDLSTKYGFLCFSTSSPLLLHEDESVVRRIEDLITADMSAYEPDGFDEYATWKYLITQFFPPNLPYLESWVKSKNIEYGLPFLNRNLTFTMVVFTSLKMNKFDVIPTALISAIILYIKAKKHNKEPFFECNYEPCKKIVINNIGKGKPKKYCSNSCKSMAWRLKQNNPQT